MSPAIVVLGLLAVAIAILMGTDRALQAKGKPPGRAFDAVQLAIALCGVVLHGIIAGGIGWAARFFLVLLLVPAVIETAGLHSGLIFGRYRYTGKAGPRLPGGVPVVVVLMWFGLLYVTGTTGLMAVMTLGPGDSIFAAACIASLLMVWWDLAGDPVAVHEGLWQWKRKGRWYGVPLTNYIGWLLTSLVVLLIAFHFAGGFPYSVTLAKSPWVIRLPAFLFALLLFNYAGAARSRGLTAAGYVALAGGIVTLAAALV